MTSKEARTMADIIEVTGYDSAPWKLLAINDASATHHFVVARDQQGKWLVGAYDIALDRWLLSGCGKKFTPAEWFDQFKQETL
jgi:hypothetical protein